MRNLKFVLAAALLVSSCATAPTNSISSGAIAPSESARYKVFGLEKECPLVCGSLVASASGEEEPLGSYSYFVRAVDRSSGGDLVAMSLVIQGEEFLSNSGTVVVVGTVFQISTTVESTTNPGSTRTVQLNVNYVTSDYSITIGGITDESSGALTIFQPNMCEFIPPN